MRIPTIEVARANLAYGLRLTNRAQATTPASKPASVSRAPDQLVAASVRESVTFEAQSHIRSTEQAPLQLYTRAADKLEVATAVQLGRGLDVTG